MALDGTKLGDGENPDKAEDTLCGTSIEDSFGMFGASNGQSKGDTKTGKFDE